MTNEESLSGTALQNAEEKDNSDFFKREVLEGTPFVAIYQEGTGWFLTMGKNRISEPVEDKQIIYDMVKNPNWDILTNVIIIMVKQITDEKND